MIIKTVKYRKLEFSICAESMTFLVGHANKNDRTTDSYCTAEEDRERERERWSVRETDLLCYCRRLTAVTVVDRWKTN